MDALAFLRLQIEWGADDALSEQPVDRLRELPPATGRTVVSPSHAAVSTAVPTPIAAPGPFVPRPGAPAGSATERATAAAESAADLAELRAATAAFDGCALRDTASNLVFAEGDPAAGILFIGDPPGAEEDRSGHPFAGRDGELLDQMLSSIGLARTGVLLTPLIPWRPPGGRPPNAGELATCLPFLRRLIALTSPAHIVVLGALAARTLLAGRARPGTSAVMRPEWDGLPAILLPGIAAMQKTPTLRREAWAGLRRLHRAVHGQGNGQGQGQG
jgi:uracil-DNA glycosylase